MGHRRAQTPYDNDAFLANDYIDSAGLKKSDSSTLRTKSPNKGSNDINQSNAFIDATIN